MTWRIFTTNKKGQTEDLIADLIPAIIITIIAIYLLGSLPSTNKTNVDERVEELDFQLGSKIDFITFLRMHSAKEPIVDKELQEVYCSYPRLSTADIIAKIDPEKARSASDFCYSRLIDIVEDFNKINSGENCMMVNLNFPAEDINLRIPPRNCALTQKQEREFFLPLKSGGYVDITILTKE